MLTHIVCWKYKPETTAEQHAYHIARLRALVDVVPGIRTFEVGPTSFISTVHSTPG